MILFNIYIERHEVESSAGVIHFSPQSDIKGPNEEV